MKELDEMEKVNAKLSAAVEEVTQEHCKKNEVTSLLHLMKLSRWSEVTKGAGWVIVKRVVFFVHIERVGLV